MTDQVSEAVSATARLRAALEQVADALVAPRLETLLAGEAAIERALADMQPLDTLSAGERPLARRELERARQALMRCRRLGSALTAFVRISFEAQGRGPAYGPRPGSSPTYAGTALNTRV